jgi:hypothetical protein
MVPMRSMMRCRWDRICTVLILLSVLPMALAPKAHAEEPFFLGAPHPMATRLVRLVVWPDRVSPGHTVRVRLVNNGMSNVGYGEELSIQKKVSDEWVGAPFKLPVSGEVAYGLAPGEASSWETVRIPKNAVPGIYRAVKPLTINESDRRRTAEFRVVPEGRTAR